MGKSLGYGEITITNMTEPFTVMLTNEAQQFATDSNRKVVTAQSYYTDIIVMRGTQERTDYTIGNITANNRISVSKTAKRVTFSVSVGNVISADAGAITIPITLDGQTVNKTFSWSCTKQGIQGVKGEKGQDAKSITITPSAQIFKSTDGGNTFTPNQITITHTLQGDIIFGKWQYSINGGVSFTDVVSGQSGLTVDANKKLTVAKTSALFSDTVTMVTFRAVASDSSFYDTCSIAKLYDVTDIEIGGVNLIKNSNFANGIDKWIPTGITYAIEEDSTYGHHIKFSSSATGDIDHRLLARTDNNFIHIMNTTYTLSFYAKASSSTQLQSNVGAGANAYNYSLTTSWKKFSFTYTATSEGSLTFWAVEANKDIYLANIKLERGNKPTDYTVSPEDVQTAILSTKNEISSVSQIVDQNKKAIEQRVSKTTYDNDLKIIRDNVDKANDGINKWRYEIYPKSLFKSEDQSKYTADIFATNKNLTPSQTVLLDDTKLSTGMDYGDQHIAYALTFIKTSAKKDVSTKMFNDDGASLYVNGQLVVSRSGEYTNGQDISLPLAQGWNCIEVVLNEGVESEGFRFSTTLSSLSECQIMNCYYGTPIARQSRITNQLVQNTTDISGVTSTVQDVMTAVGNSGSITEFKSNYSKWKQNVDNIESRVGSTYVTKDDFDGLEIGGRNLIIGSSKADVNSNWKQNGWSGSFTTYSADERIYKLVANDGWHNARYTGLSEYIGQEVTISFKAKNISAETTAVDNYNLLISNETGTNPYSNSGNLIEGTITQDVWISLKATVTLNADGQIGIISKCSAEGKGYKTTWLIKDLKLEKGNKATDWTPAPEDVNGKIQNVESVATQTANKFSWLVKSGDSSSNFELTDRTATLVANAINLNGLVKFDGLSNDAKNKINKGADWVSNYGTNTNTMYNMVSKWANGAVSDSTKINGGLLETNTVLARSIAVGDFTNYCDDPRFEKGIYTGGGSFAISTEQKYVGTKSMKMRAGTKSFYSTLISQDFELSAGEKVYVEYYVYRNGADKNAGVSIASSASDYGEVVWDISGQRFATPDVADKTWTRISYIGTANRAGMWFAVFKLGSNDTLNGDWYLDNVTIRKMTTGQLIVDGAITADKIATDAIKSRNYISSGGTEGSFLNLADGTFDSKYLKWDSTGKLTATSGMIGRYKITDSYLATGSGATTAGMGGNQAFWAGNSESNDAPFRVGYNGKLVANGATLTTATVSGIITATDGRIGDLELKNGSLTGTGNYTDSDNATRTYTTVLSKKGLSIESIVGSDNSTKYTSKIMPDYIRFSDVDGECGLGTLGVRAETPTGRAIMTGDYMQLSYGGDNAELYFNVASGGMTIDYAPTSGASTTLSIGSGWDFSMFSVDGKSHYLRYNLYSTLESSLYFVVDGLRSTKNVSADGTFYEGGTSLSNKYAAKSHEHWYLKGGNYRVGVGSSTTRFCAYTSDGSGGANNTLYLGYGNALWKRVYAASATISTSDQRLKENIQSQDERYEKLFDNLQPVTYKWKGSDHDRVHTGFIAQQVKTAMDVAGLTTLDFGAFCYDNFYDDPEWKPSSTEGMTDRYSLAYEEFISLNTHMIQKTRKELSETNQEIINLKKENAELKETLKQIMKKLNM